MVNIVKVNMQKYMHQRLLVYSGQCDTYRTNAVCVVSPNAAKSRKATVAVADIFTKNLCQSTGKFRWHGKYKK